MKRLVLWNVWLIGCCLTASSALADALPFPEDLVVVRAQPAVLKLQVKGKIKVTYPESSFADMALLDREYTNDREHTGPATSKTDYLWEKVATNPAKYLRGSIERDTQELTDVQYASATGFAVGREGILLTNAHVVAGPEDGFGLNDVESAIAILRQPLDGLFQRLVKDFEGQPQKAIHTQLLVNLVKWMVQQSTTVGKFSRVDVVLEYVTNELERELLRPRSFAEMSGAQPKPARWEILRESPPFPRIVPAEVLKVGEPIPGKDVAVLRVARAQDRLICLPLGDSDDVLPGARVQALGFPGLSFNPALMDASADFRVSSRQGQFGQTRQMKGGWDALEMTALIYHSDSGGPVLDRQGAVIGLNVGAANPALPLVTLAVPINVAKEFLIQAGITPDPGPLTAQWEESLRLYSASRFVEAFEKLLDVGAMQRAMHREYSPTERATIIYPSPFMSPYVSAMQNRCIKSGRIPLDTVHEMMMKANERQDHR